MNNIAENFARKYAGQEVVVINYTQEQELNGTMGRVVAFEIDDGSLWDDLRVIIELNDYISGYNPHLNFVVDPSTIKTHSCLRFPPQCLYPMPSPTLSNAPDNCDDCGAVGEQRCKDSCPNRENT